MSDVLHAPFRTSAANVLPGVSDRPGIRGPALLGMAALVLGCGGFFGWAAVAPLSSAAVAPGIIKVESSRKTIQHQQGGTVADLLVRDGDHVRAGQPLVRLDDVETRAQLDMLDGAHVALSAEEVRLRAERDGLDQIVFPAELEDRRDDPRIAEVLAGQTLILTRERQALASQIDVLGQRIAQSRAQISALEAQLDSGGQQLGLIREEMAAVAGLVEKGLEKRPRLLALQRNEASLVGGQGEYRGRIAAARQSIGEAEMQITTLRQNRMREVASTLRDVQVKRGEAVERLRAARSTQERRDILAPEDGVVMNLRYFTPGAVIPPGGPILDLVPGEDRLVVEAKVQPTDIDVVHEGLKAQVVLSAYKSRTTPRLAGEVVRVSADALTDERSGASYFLARVAIDPADLPHLSGGKLYPGMPAETYIVTGERTALAYLTQPIVDSFRRAFRED